jgi:hypothetical protein
MLDDGLDDPGALALIEARDLARHAQGRDPVHARSGGEIDDAFQAFEVEITGWGERSGQD